MVLHRLSSQSGQGTVEWAGALALVALIVAAVIAVGFPTSVANALECSVKNVLTGGGGSCAQRSGQQPPDASAPWDSSDPVTRATWGAYVSLGDSYSAGEGLGNYEPGSHVQHKDCGVIRIPFTHVCDHDKTVVTKSCDRSASAYNATVSHDYGFKGGKQTWACSGSITRDIYDGPGDPTCKHGAASGTHGEGCQVDRVTKDTSLVTLSIGGNDAGFAADLQGCYKHHGLQLLLQGATGGNRVVRGTSCSGEAGAINQGINDLKPRLKADLQAIRARAPHARIIVVTYPRLFPQNPSRNVDCASHIVHICLTPADQRFLNREAAILDNAICSTTQAAGVGAECVNALDAFDGCESGQSDSCVQSLSVSTSAESWNPLKDVHANPGAFHPTAKGQEILGQLINQEIANPPPGVGGH